MALMTWSTKWISKWRGHGTQKSIFGYHGWLTRIISDSTHSRKSEIVTS